MRHSFRLCLLVIFIGSLLATVFFIAFTGPKKRKYSTYDSVLLREYIAKYDSSLRVTTSWNSCIPELPRDRNSPLSPFNFVFTLEDQVEGISFEKLRRSLVYVTERHELELSQVYDKIVGETLESMILREQSTETSNRNVFLAKSMKDTRPSSPHHRVPPLLHFILFYPDGQLQFHHMVCLLGAFWRLQPRYMVLWHNRTFEGEYWQYLKQNFSSVANRIVLLPVTPPRRVYTQPVDILEHQADILRLEILYEFGGVFLDHDAVVVKSMEPLFQFPFTIGRESPVGLCNGIMMGERHSEFVRLWHQFYRQYETEWALISVLMPHTLHAYFTTLFMLHHRQHDLDRCLIHVEEESLDRPNWTPEEVRWIYDKTRVWKWREKNYAVHLWIRMSKTRLNWTTVKEEDSMYGELFRDVLFGNPSLPL